jgi:hypothetical protein
MLKIYFMISAVLLLSACASAPVTPISPFVATLKETPNEALLGKKMYRVASVELNFQEVVSNPAFYSRKDLDKKFAEQLEEKLKERNIFATASDQAVLLSAVFNYKRSYMGEAFGMSKQLGGGNCRVSATMEMPERKITATYTGQEKIISHSLVSGFAKMAGSFSSAAANPAEEDETVALCVNELTSILPK